MEVLRLLPPDTRIGLKNQESLKELFSEKPSEIKEALNIDKQRFYRYKHGKTRLSKEQLTKLSKSFGFSWEDNIDSFGLEGSLHTIRLPEKIEITENISWLVGFHSTESSETPKSFGVCNSELSLIKRSEAALSELGIDNKMMQLEIRYISGKEKIVSENRKYLDGFSVRFRKLSSDSLTRQPLYTLRVSSRLIKDCLNSLEKHLYSNFNGFGIGIQAAFLQGIYDADGWFNKAKRIVVLSQRDSSFVDMVCDKIQSLKISTRREYWKYRDYHVCVVIFGKKGKNLKRFLEIIGFSHPIKAARVKDFL